MWVEYIPAIISAVGAIICGWFAYNQESKNKMTDLKIEQIKNEDKVQNRRRSDNSAIIFGELWSVLYESGADRVYIIQPHPLGREEMISVYYEVKKKGVEGMRSHIQQLKISELERFASTLVKNRFLYLNNPNEQLDDKYARSIILSCGCKHAIVKKLSDTTHDWVGSIFVEFNNEMNINEDRALELLRICATNIQYILPEIRA